MQERIIHFLKASSSYLSGEEISRSLSLSRAAVWKHIEELRRQGYGIEAAPRKGYRLTDSPDKLFPQEISYQLGTAVLGREIHYQDKMASTMDTAFELGRQGAAEGTVVCTDEQTSGRGRMGRTWISPRGSGIYMSLILRPRMGLSEAAKLTLLAAVAVCEAVNQTADVGARIKWPNDILCGRRKLAGILTELSAEVDRVNFVVLGIGINVNTPAASLPPEATSLKAETKRRVLRVPLTQDILRRLDHWYAMAGKEGFDAVLRRWKDLTLTLGQRVRVDNGYGSVEGEAVDLADDGGLMVRTRGGEILKRMSGDVMMLG